MVIILKNKENSAMFGFGKNKKQDKENETLIKEVTNSGEFESLLKNSHSSPVFFLKHSTRCPISKWAFDELVEAEKKMARHASFAFLDLIAFREVSNFIAHQTGIKHESPQLFYFNDGEVKEVLTHQDVKATAIADLMGLN